MITHDKISGSLYGLALGDALGRPTEFMRLPEIHRRYGRHGVMDLPRPALFTDDTQMTLAVARALNDARGLYPAELVRTLTNEFIRWQVEDHPRAPGITCMTAVRALSRCRRWHRPWTEGTVMSKGCGANMRVAPTALLPDMGDAINVSQLQAAITHGHPVALAATELTALAIRWAAEGADLIELPRMLYGRALTQRGVYRDEWLRGLARRWRGDANENMVVAWSHMAATVERVMRLLAVTDRASRVAREKLDVCRALGAAWTADEALACSLFFAVRYGDNATLAISEAARTNGDSDSIACITGAIVGAYHGEATWPTRWVDRIERGRDIEVAADTLWSRYPVIY